MSEMRVSDPSKLHLLRKEELSQIRKAARVLRDPGTTSSWRSPLAGSSRSGAAPAANPPPRGLKKNGLQGHSDFPLPPPAPVADDKKVFLHNWKTYKSSAGATARNDDEDGGGSSSVAGTDDEDDSLSDARNGVDSRSDTSLGEKLSSMIFRCNSRDAANLMSSSARASVTRTTGFKKKKNSKKIGKSKKVSANTSKLDALSAYQHNQMLLDRSNLLNSSRLLKVKEQFNSNSMPLGLSASRGESVDPSDDDDYSNSEDLHKLSGASPLLLKLKQHKNWSQSSSRLFKNGRKDDSSYTYSTPALSTSSYNRYVNHNPSTIGSWDATTASLNDEDADEHLDLPGSRGCGIPCYWSKRTPKHRMCRSCYSPSLSDTLRRKGSSILCGSQNMYHRRHQSSSGPNKRKFDSKSAKGILPLLTNSADGRGGSSIGTGLSDDELSTNFGELDLEALSRLDGRRWSSSCRSQEGLEIVAINGEGEEEGTPENIRSLSQKYKPMFFDELIGQNIVVQSLTNAISRGRIAPMYLFQGPRGTGKTSAARIFAASLNCVSTEDTKPCGYCSECTDFFSGRSRDLWEVDGTTMKGIERVRHLLRKLLAGPPSAFLRYKVFVIDECHLLPSKTWLTFLKFLEDPPQRLVFIFITTDLDNVPRTIQSRCQKYHFNKIKDGDIISRLRNIASSENLDVESDALDLIALNTDGSLRDAETMLDQLSLLGKRITTTLVNELVGVVSDDKLLELLELAMSSDTAETVKRARELMDSGVDPTVLMSQMASLIMDIIAGTYKIVDAKDCDSAFGGRSLTEAELERLKHALKLLSEAEKQIRISSERSTWFTATLLQLGSVTSSEVTQSGSSRRQSSKTTEEDPSSASREAQYVPRQSTSPASLHKAVNVNSSHVDMMLAMDGCNFNAKPSHRRFIDGSVSSTSHDDAMIDNMIARHTNSENLDDIWARCIEKCHSKTLRQLLHSHGKLLSISEVEGLLVAYVAFCDGDIKIRAERFMSSITNSIEIVLKRNVEVRIILLPDGEASIDYLNSIEPPKGQNHMGMTVAIEREKEPVKASGRSLTDLDVDAEISGTKEKSQEIPMQRIESIIREQRLETAWLQTADKGTPRSLSRLKPEKNQVLPQDGTYCPNKMESMNSSALSSQHWEDELNHELKVLKVNDGKGVQKDQIGRRVDNYPMSPSLLHDSSLVGNFNKDNPGYESGSGTGGCSGLFCWKSKHPIQAKVKGTPVRQRKGRRLALFGNCGKPKKRERRVR